MPSKYLEIAARMLNPTYGEGEIWRLHKGLVEELKRIDRLCGSAGGSLKSRQVIAMIIDTWIQANPDEEPYTD